MRFKVGDIVKAALEGDGYVADMTRTFEKNNLVEIIKVNKGDRDYKVIDYLGRTWWIYEKDIIGQENQCGYFIS